MMKEAAAGILVIVGVFSAILAGVFWLWSAQCYSKWSDFTHDWGIVSGCRVLIDGRMVPADNVRDVDLPAPDGNPTGGDAKQAPGESLTAG